MAAREARTAFRLALAACLGLMAAPLDAQEQRTRQGQSRQQSRDRQLETAPVPSQRPPGAPAQAAPTPTQATPTPPVPPPTPVTPPARARPSETPLVTAGPPGPPPVLAALQRVPRRVRRPGMPLALASQARSGRAAWLRMIASRRIEQPRPDPRGDRPPQSGTRESTELTSAQPRPATPFPWALLFGVAAGIVVVLAAALAWSLRRYQQLTASYRDSERVVAEQLNVEMQELPKAMEQIYAQIEELVTDNNELKRKLEVGGRTTAAAGSGPGAMLVALMTEAVEKAREALSSAKDPEIAGIDQVLGIGKSLATLASALRATDGPDSDARIAGLLERGHLDGALTIAPFLDSYARERNGLIALRRELGRLETLARAALRHADIEVLVPAPLTQLDELPEGSVGDDRRGVRRIAMVRDRALSAARRLAPGRFMVVDCHTPGFLSNKIGRRAPGLAMFDPAAWT